MYINLDKALADKFRRMADDLDHTAYSEKKEENVEVKKEVKPPKEPIPDDGTIHIRVKNKKKSFNFKD